MARFGRVPSGGKAPFCADCGSLEAHVVSRGEGSLWLCGSCEYLRENPDAATMEHPQGLPRSWPKGRGKPQKESLF